jgi:hypothetical protein
MQAVKGGRDQWRRYQRERRGSYRKMMTGGLHLSLGRREGAYRFGFLTPGGPWAACGTGPIRFPGSIFIFFSSLLLFFFYFLNSFIDFAKMLQINSNHFQNFCKIHSKF